MCPIWWRLASQSSVEPEIIVHGTGAGGCCCCRRRCRCTPGTPAVKDAVTPFTRVPFNLCTGKRLANPALGPRDDKAAVSAKNNTKQDEPTSAMRRQRWGSLPLDGKKPHMCRTPSWSTAGYPARKRVPNIARVAATIRPRRLAKRATNPTSSEFDSPLARDNGDEHLAAVLGPPPRSAQP
ncbi:unnamed protein product [Lampetra fluviatilis]